MTDPAYADAQLYMSARLSAISLTYYGFCLASGQYTVFLHFAEIMFTNDSTYTSLGRRLFDVYIQVPTFTLSFVRYATCTSYVTFFLKKKSYFVLANMTQVLYQYILTLI